MSIGYASIYLENEKCVGCTRCMQRCPTEAIRIRDGKATILRERCVDCGECIRVCPRHAMKARVDTLSEALGKYKYTIALPAQALYGQFPGVRTRAPILEGLLRIGLPCFEPKGAFYVFPDIRGTGLSSEDFCERFLMEEKVAVIPGSAFGPGGEGFVRACYAASMKDIAESISRLDNFLVNLRRRQGHVGQ